MNGISSGRKYGNEGEAVCAAFVDEEGQVVAADGGVLARRFFEEAIPRRRFCTGGGDGECLGLDA